MPSIAARERRRDVRLRALGRRGGCSAIVDVDPVEMPEIRRLDAVPARHLGPPGAREQRVGAHPGAADPGDPDPPTGERPRGRRAHPRSPPLHPASPPRASRPPSPPAARRRRGARRRAPGSAPPRAPGTTTRAAGALEPAGVLLLVVAGRELARDEHRRQPGRRELPDRAAGTRDREVGGAVREADLVDERQQPVVRPRTRPRQVVVVALAAEVERPPGRSRAHASTASSFSRRAPSEPPKTSTTGPSAGSSSRCPRLVPRRPHARPPASGRPTARYFSALGSHRQGEEDAARERCRQPVGEPEVRVRLGHAPPGSAAARQRAPSARRRSRRRRGRRRGAAARGSAGTPLARRAPGRRRAAAAAPAGAAGRRC